MRMRWLIKCWLLVNLLSSCVTKYPYYQGVIIGKSQPGSRIQTVLIGLDFCNLHINGCDSLHFVYPRLTIDERDSLQIGDTIYINKDNLKLWQKE